MEKVNLKQKLSLIKSHWTPKIVAQLDDMHVKVSRVLGEFPWHSHENEDELFFVVKGQLRIEFRDREVTLEEGEFLVVPRGVEHRPVAESEVHMMLIESKNTLNTGNVRNVHTLDELEWI